MLKKSPRETNRKTLGSLERQKKKKAQEKATTKHGKSLRRQIVERVGSVEHTHSLCRGKKKKKKG